MADRNPSKQRRQAQNRAVREARQARAHAANTPVEERREAPEEPAPSKAERRRQRKTREEIRSEARALVESETSSAAVDGASEAVDLDALADSDTSPADDVNADSSVADSSVAEPSLTDGVGVGATPRRGASPVFSSRHRAAIATATQGRAPARTHTGVAAATGLPSRPVEVLPTTTAGTRTAERSASNRTASTRTASTRTASTRTASTRTNSTTRSESSRGSTKPNARAGNRPPAKPLPPVFDRFGGNEPGGRFVMFSFATIVVASIVMNFVHLLPEMEKNAKGKLEATGRSFTIWHYGAGAAMQFLLPPVIILGLFIATAKPWDRRRSWNWALAMLVMFTFFLRTISIYVIPIGLLAWGCWQARKAALENVGGDPQVLREVERERRLAARKTRRSDSSKRS